MHELVVVVVVAVVDGTRVRCSGRWFGLRLDRNGEHLQLGKRPLLVAVASGGLGSWDTVPLASLASEFHGASGTTENWPVCAGYSHERAGLRHEPSLWGSAHQRAAQSRAEKKIDLMLRGLCGVQRM